MEESLLHSLPKPGMETSVDKFTILSNLLSQHLVLNMFNVWLRCWKESWEHLEKGSGCRYKLGRKSTYSLGTGCPGALNLCQSGHLRDGGVSNNTVPKVQLIKEQPTNKLSPMFVWSEQNFAKISHLQLMASVHVVL